MTGQKAPVLALILAGGLGRRMGGTSKPMLDLGGVRLIERVIRAAQAQCEAVAINLHDATPEAQAAFAPFDLPLLADALPGHAGPLAGVLAGLDYAAAKGFGALLSLPCDCPFLPDDLAARLYEAAQKSPAGLACAASGGRTHHVVALWPTRLREKLRRALVDEDLRKVGQFQQTIGCAQVEWFFRTRDPFFNVNTPEELLQAQEWLAMRLEP
jgi:molybdopterin-guanine dinucleotide biosynthesis protein A